MKTSSFVCEMKPFIGRKILLYDIGRKLIFSVSKEYAQHPLQMPLEHRTYDHYIHYAISSETYDIVAYDRIAADKDYMLEMASGIGKSFLEMQNMCNS